MDFGTILILGLLGGAAYLFYAGTPASPVSPQTSPTPTMPLQPAATPGAPVSTPGTVMSTAPAPTAPSTASAGPLINASSYCGPNCRNAKFMQFLKQAIEIRYLPANPIIGGAGTGSGGCPASSPTGQSAAAKFATLGAGLASLATTGIAAGQAAAEGVSIAATSAGGAIPFVGIGVAIVGLISQIFAHHAQAVKMQSNVLCENVPAANVAFAAIDQALAANQMTPAQAAQAYSQLGAQFSSAMHSDPSYKSGDALDGYNTAMGAVVAQRQLDLQNGVSSYNAGMAFGGATAGSQG